MREFMKVTRKVSRRSFMTTVVGGPLLALRH